MPRRRRLLLLILLGPFVLLVIGTVIEFLRPRDTPPVARESP